MAKKSWAGEVPFRVGGIVEPPYFVGRAHDIEELSRDLRGLVQNRLILAPRRFGKSSLLHNLRLSVQAEPDLLVPYVNCRDVASYADFHRATVSALLAELERTRPVGGLLKRYAEVFKGQLTRALERVEEIGGAIGEAGRVYLKFRDRAVDEHELARETFRFFRALAEEKQVKVVFMLDEFQEVAAFDGYMFNLLKKELDLPSPIRYFFSGSSMRLIARIFLHEEAPLYLMVSRHFMGPLREDVVVTFVQERLALVNLRIGLPAARRLYGLTGGIPFYVQKLGGIVVQRALLDGTEGITLEHVERAFDAMSNELDSEFEVRWLSRFSPLQRRIVRGLARLGQARVTDLAAHIEAKPTDISSSLSRLKDMMIIGQQENGSYVLIDTVFAGWLRTV